MLLDEQGAFWHLENGSPVAPRVNRAAVHHAFRPQGAVLHEDPVLPPAVTDSLLQASLWERAREAGLVHGARKSSVRAEGGER